MQINTKAILDGITKTLRLHFPNYQIYTESVKQGLIEPAFIVRAITTNRSPINRNLVKQIHSFNITYLSGDLNDCYNVQDKLFNILEIIELKNGVRIFGHDINSKMGGDMLNVGISFSYHLFGKSDEIFMENQNITQEIV